MFNKVYKTNEEALKAHKFDKHRQVTEAGKNRLFNNWNKFTGVSQDEFLKNLEWVCADPLQICPDDPRKVPRRTRMILCLWSGEILKIDCIYYRNGEFQGFFYHDDSISWHPDQDDPEKMIRRTGLRGHRMFHSGKSLKANRRTMETAWVSELWHVLPPNDYYTNRHIF